MKKGSVKQNGSEEINVRAHNELQKVFDGTSDAIFLVEQTDKTTFRYIGNNRSHQRLTGFSPEQLRGKTPQELIGDATGSIIAKNYKRCVQGKKPITYEETLDLPGGQRIWETTLTPVFATGENPLIVGSSEDVTKRKQAKEELRAIARRAKLQRAAMVKLSVGEYRKEADFKKCCQQVTRLCSRTLLVERVGIWLFNDNMVAMDNIALYQASSKQFINAPKLFAKDLPGYFNALLNENRLYSSDVQNDPRTAELKDDYLVALGITSMLDAGIIADGKLVGVVCFEHIGEKRTWHLDEEAFASNIATFVAQVLISEESRKAKENLVHSERMLNLVMNTIPVRVFWKDLRGVYLGCNKPFANDAGKNHPDEVIGKTDNEMPWKDQVALYRGDDKKVIESGVPKINYEEPQTTPGGDTIYLKTSKIPLKNNEDEIIGVLGTYEDITALKKEYTIRDIQYNIAHAVVTSKTLKDLLMVVKSELNQVMDTANFFIAFYDRQTDTLSPVIWEDEKDSFTRWPADKTFSGLVAKKKKSLLFGHNDVFGLAKENNIELIGSIPEKWLGVPLISGESILGVIVVQSYDNPHAFDEDSKVILEIVASQLSLYIEHIRYEEALVTARDKAEEGDRLKTAFLNNLSHEIRTPLNAIMGFSEILTKGILDNTKTRQANGIINRSGTQLLSIIDDIINMSGIEAGVIKASESECNINELIQGMHEQMLPLAEGKSIDLKIRASMDNETGHILTDTTKLTQILTNLLQNAIKFTDQGHVEFGCRVKDKVVHFHVADTGMGISSEDQEIIFERFRQGGVQPGGGQSGLGLGLSISKSFVELLGGRIWVESQPDIGSTFYFTIPWKPSK